MNKYYRKVHTAFDKTPSPSDTVPLEYFLPKCKYGLLANVFKSWISSALTIDS